MSMKSLAIAVVAASACAACVRSDLVLTGHAEATRRTSAMHTEFTKAADWSNRSVMSTAEATTLAAAAHARTARAKVTREIDGLRTLLADAGYRDAGRLLDEFAARFADYQRLDDELLSMVGEHSNLKAQRLSFGEARDAVADLQSALAADGSIAALRTQIGALEILAAQAPHIAEPNDDAMTRMEAGMAASDNRVRQALASVNSSYRQGATAAFDRFMAVHKEILVLSRRNSNVRSLALALGQKWTVTAQCDAALQAIEEELAKHAFRATR
jgi:hypothetical protein